MCGWGTVQGNIYTLYQLKDTHTHNAFSITAIAIMGMESYGKLDLYFTAPAL